MALRAQRAFNEIEKTGATYDEVLEFLLFAGARKIKAHEIYNI